MKKIILVDDDFEDAEFFQYAVNVVGTPIDFLHVESSECLFKTLAVNPTDLPDLIFLDLNLPKVDGFQCLKELKSSCNYTKIPVLIYSTSSDEQDKELAKELGAVDFISKPFELSTLIEKLKSIVLK